MNGLMAKRQSRLEVTDVKQEIQRMFWVQWQLGWVGP